MNFPESGVDRWHKKYGLSEHGCQGLELPRSGLVQQGVNTCPFISMMTRISFGNTNP